MGKSPGETGFKFTWERKVAECRLGAATKSVAMWLSHHANGDGTNSRPGIRLLAHETEQSERTVRRCLDHLREIGLIVRTLKGSTAAKRKFADTYNLVIPEDLETHVRVEPRPDDHRKGHGRTGVANHARWHEQRGKFDPSCIHCTEAQEPLAKASGGLPEGSAEPLPEGATPIRPLAKRNPTSGQTESDHRPAEQYHQPCTTNPVKEHSVSSDTGSRASSRAYDPGTYKSFMAAELKKRIHPGEKLTAEDEETLFGEIDYDYVTSVVGDLDEFEEPRVQGMLLRRFHPRRVINAVLHDRPKVA